MIKVRVIYDPILRKEVKSVTVFNEKLKELSEEMLLVMHKNIGMGLAANQLGVDTNLLVVEYRPAKDDKESKPIPPKALCNARIVKSSQETSTKTEGCLSLPGLELLITRPSGVTVEAQDLTGKPVIIKAKGLLARILQHEVDHLDGILFTDHAQGVKNIRNYNWANIVFFGSDEFSCEVLSGLIASGLKVVAVVTETDKRAGRGDTTVAPLVKNLAKKLEIPVIQPENKEEITSVLKQLSPDLVVLASYGKILPEEALEIPVYGALNVHPSLLPKYRGATPLQSAILEGEKETGVTIMKMNKGIDTGEIVSQTTTQIADDETFTTLRKRLSTIGSQLLIKSIPSYLSGQADLELQGSDSTQTKKLVKEMGEIDWNESPEQIYRKVRALNPWPGTFTFLGDKRLKILETSITDNQVMFKVVQLEGKNPTNWSEFVRGYEQQLKNCSWYSRIS